MTFAKTTLPEFDHEMAITRRVLERFREERAEWRANEKSNTLGWNACHLAEIPGWTANILTEPFFDGNPTGDAPHKTPHLATTREILEFFDANVAEGRTALESIADASVTEVWEFRDHGTVLLQMPRGVAFRTWVMSHTIHHRAILTVYYRLLGVPVPAVYGPSADEQGG